MRLKTLGFETGALSPGIENYTIFGSPEIVSDGNVRSGNYAVKMSAPSADPETGYINNASLAGSLLAGVPLGGSIMFTDFEVADFIPLRATIKNGGGYFRIYVKVGALPDLPHCFTAYKRESDSLNMVGIEMEPDGSLQLFYRNDAGDRTNIGLPREPLQQGQYYQIEYGVIGNPTGTNRHIEARVNDVIFAAEDVTDLSATDGFMGFGFDLETTDGATEGVLYIDDVAINDGLQANRDGSPTEQFTWPGSGKVVRWNVVALDENGNSGWTRGGADSGSDYGQIDELDPNDATDYLISADDGDSIEFKVTNPYDLGIKVEDTITSVGMSIRWRVADETSSSFMDVFIRAGHNLIKHSRNIAKFGTDWFTGNGNLGGFDDQLEILNLTFLPQSDDYWDVDELTAMRVGMQTTDSDPDINVTALWGYIEYRPYESQTDFRILIDDEDRTADVRFQTLQIEDILNEQANTAGFQMYDLHSLGAPERGETIEVFLNGLKIFGGLLTKVTYDQLQSNERDIYDVKCIDWTRVLDRRLVAATYQNMTDKEIIETIINEYAHDDDITTYHVAEGVTINQISFNYIPVSRAIAQIAELTGRHWYIDYDKDIHYFPLTQSKTPFAITSAGNEFSNFKLSKDDKQLRNRVFVRGGTELTTSPITENLVADGEQRQFLIAEKPHDIVVELNSVPQTVGIKNIDDPAEFDWLLSFQEKYIEAGSGTATPIAGDIVSVTYNYDIPVLVAVEDSNSIAEEAAKSGGSGVYEHVIIDKQIATTQQARDRASAELTDYAAGITEAQYETLEKGIRSGQYQRVTMANKDVDEDYIVNKVTFQSLGGGLFTHSIKLSSVKTLGIIKFLIKLLEVNRTVGEFDPNESVDQFFSLSDQLDSMTDSLTIDSQGYGFPWAPDVGASSTDLKWDLGQWT